MLSQNPFKIIQLSYVFKDIKHQAQLLELLFDMPKFTFYEYVNAPIIYRDKKTRISLKCGRSKWFNSYSIELIQLVEGKYNLFYDFLSQGREGLHHIDVLVQNYEEYLDFFKQKGISVLQKGKSIQRWAFLDTEKSLGIIVELVEGAPPKRERKAKSLKK